MSYFWSGQNYWSNSYSYSTYSSFSRESCDRDGWDKTDSYSGSYWDKDRYDWNGDCKDWSDYDKDRYDCNYEDKCDFDWPKDCDYDWPKCNDPCEPENIAPRALPVEAKICANDLIDAIVAFDLLAGAEDDDGDALAITAINGQALVVGETLVLADGFTVTLQADGQVHVAGLSQYLLDLQLGENVAVNFTFTVSDGEDSVTSDGTLNICGSAETVEDIAAWMGALDVEFQVASSYPSVSGSPDGDAYDIRIDGTGNALLDGLELADAYCLDAFRPTHAAETFDVAPVLSGDLFVFTEDALPADAFAGQVGRNGQTVVENIDLINWILNQDFEAADYDGVFTDGVTDAEIQATIWQLTNDLNYFLPSGTGQVADVQTLYGLAIAHGKGFVPGAGDVFALAVLPDGEDGNEQPFIVTVPFDDFDCLCL